MQLSESQIKDVVKQLKETSITPYQISKETSISQGTLSNYRLSKTFPTPAIASILKQFFDTHEKCNNDDLSFSNSNSDNEKYRLLERQIELLQEQNSALLSQLRAKDETINQLLNLIRNERKETY